MIFSGLAYRAHVPVFAKDPMSGEGARLYGGRFNKPGLPALYMATDVTTAINEISQSFEHKFDPVTLCTYEVECEDVLDLKDPDNRIKYNIEFNDLACAWSLLALEGKEVPSWQIADRLIASGIAGVIVPSWAPKSTETNSNLVLWKWSDKEPHKVTVVDREGRLNNI